MIAGAKLWHFVVDDSHFATEFLKRQSKLGLSGEINFIAIDEILSNPEKMVRRCDERQEKSGLIVSLE